MLIKKFIDNNKVNKVANPFMDDIVFVIDCVTDFEDDDMVTSCVCNKIFINGKYYVILHNFDTVLIQRKQ